MIALIQRVAHARVSVAQQVVGKIGPGMLIFLGVETGDLEADRHWLVGKVAKLRLFEDDNGKPNLDLRECGGQVLVISQFSLTARTAKGNRPSFIDAANPAEAEAHYRHFIEELSEQLGQLIETGRFGAEMAVELLNDGPFTLWIDSRRRR